MKNIISDERKQFLVKLLQEAGKGIAIIIAVVMAFKFMAWNSWKLGQAADIAGEIRKEPPAVNLAISEKNSPLFQKSFAHNENGNYYIINHFDITGKLRDAADITGGNINITVNDRQITSFLLYRFNRYHVLFTGGYYFIFTTAESGIEDLVRLDQSFPGIANSLFKLAVAGKGAKGETDEEKKEIIYQCFQGVEKELTYGRARVSIPLPGPFKKGRLYEINFDYKVTGGAKAVVLVSPASNRHELDSREEVVKVEGSYRKAVLMFSPPADTAVPVLYLVGRSKGKKGPFEGTVSFKDISVYRYEREYPWLKEFHGSRVAYIDIIDSLKQDFIEVKFKKK